MPTPKNLYTDLDQWERRYAYEADLAVNDRTELARVIDAACRDIDQFCRTHFYDEIATLTLDGSGDDFLDVPDLLSVTTLLFDEDGDRVYEETVTASDYDLMRPDHERPWDALPRRRIVINPNGSYTRFPVTELGVKLTADFGYSNDTEDTGTTVSGVHTDAVKVINVAAGTALSVGMTMVIGTEQMNVTAIATNAVTVGERGLNGTTPAALVGGETVNKRVFPTQVVDAALIQSVRRWRRQEIGFIDRRSDRPQVSWHSGLDADAARELADFVRY